MEVLRTSHFLAKNSIFGVLLALCLGLLWIPAAHASPFSCTPVGRTICARLHDKGFGDKTHDGLQFLSCLSNTFIQSVSANQHGCIVRTDAHCWYPCALEERSLGINGASDRYPFNLCSCTETVKYADSDGSELPEDIYSVPSRCYSPGGMDCDWYTDCLMEMYPTCFTYDWEYIKLGVSYAQTMCRMHSENYTYNTLNWIGAAHRCLQAKLVALLRPYRNGTCWDVKTKMENAFHACVRPPYIHRGSVCDVPQHELWSMFWRLKKPFDSQLTTNPLKHALETLHRCESSFDLPPTMRVVELNFTTFDARIFHLLESIACRLRWKDAELMYFPIHPLTHACKPKLMHFLVADKQVLDQNGKQDSELIDRTLEKLLYSVSSGELDYNLFVQGRRVKIFGARILSDFPKFTKPTHTAITPNWTTEVCDMEHYSKTSWCYSQLCSAPVNGVNIFLIALLILITHMYAN